MFKYYFLLLDIMIYQVVSPFVTTIEGDSFKTAIKNFIKLNYNLNIHHMILKDQNKHIQAKMNYYAHDGRNKVGINMFPINNFSLPLNTPTYIPTNVMKLPMTIPMKIPMKLPMKIPIKFKQKSNDSSFNISNVPLKYPYPPQSTSTSKSKQILVSPILSPILPSILPSFQPPLSPILPQLLPLSPRIQMPFIPSVINIPIL